MPIVTDENILRTSSDLVDLDKDDIGALISQLESELNRTAELGRPGIGLAAIQIGIPKKIAIVRIPTSNGGLLSLNLVNCKINSGYDELIVEEGCLSFPGKYIKTKRYNEIYVMNNFVEPHSFIVTNLLAIAVQHELDHMDGILFLDRYA